MKMKKNNKISIITNVIFILIFSFITIGYALYNKELGITSNLSLKGNGELFIRSIDLVDSSNVSNSTSPTIVNNEVNFNITFNGTNNDFFANYLVTIVNNTFYDYTYTGVDLDYSLSRTDGVQDGSSLNISISGINNGDAISARSTKTFNIIVTLNANDPNATYVTEIVSDVTHEVVQEAKLLASVTPKQGNLRNSNLAHFTLDVISTFGYDRTFNINISDSNFEIVNSSGNALSELTIHANSEETYDFYVKASSNATFVNDSKTTTITLNSSGIPRITVDSITLLVNQNTTVTDTIPPVVGNVNFTMGDTEGTATATWSLIDYGLSGVDHYMINLYDDANTLINTYTGTDATSYSFTNLSEGVRYIVVYAIDDSGNSGSSYVSSATTGSGYASKSNNATLKWRYSVTNNLTNLSSNGNNYALYKQTYTATLSASGLLAGLPNSITVTMGGQTLTANTDYTYSQNNGQVRINNVTGDITITATASATCLIKGTKVLLANGKYKNIEDIGYYDLLSVFNYETGKMTKEYPIWIEKEGKTKGYQENTFSDGTVLKTRGWHGVFSVDKNEFVSVDNEEDFHVGTRILKINKNGKKEVVSVTKIEEVLEETTYYHVVSTRYYNIIANDILTTDGTVILSNLYGFNEDLTWTDLSNNKDWYTREELDILPNYMYIGLRAKEGKYLQKYGMSKEMFLWYLMNNQLTDEMLPINKNEKNELMFSVQTELDNKCYLLPEGSVYVLPKNNKVDKYLDTSQNILYKPGDSVKIELSTYFKAIVK